MRFATRNPAPHAPDRSSRLLTSTALTPAALVVAAAVFGSAAAQTVLPPNQPVPYIVNNQGGNGGPGNDTSKGEATAGTGIPGGSGTAAINIEIPAGSSLVSGTGSGNQPTISLNASGGNGGVGGDNTCNTCSYGNGGKGGYGGAGQPVTVTVDASSSPGTVITNQGSGQALLLTSNGGTGGDGGLPANRGTAGASGAAGTAGTITLTINAAASITSTGTGVNAIELTANGGNGGNGGEDTQTHVDHAYGPNGAPGQVGGSISASGNPTIVSAGSGIVATSIGGNGGFGAEAGSDVGSATGGSGGTGGNGGGITVNLGGGSVTAVGASKAGTGNTITVDAIVNGSYTTASAQASVLTTAIGAFSFGGLGGYGDYGNGGAGSGKGGGGGNAGSGGAATINTYNVTLGATGYGALGALALSVGGSGGSGGAAGAVFSRSGGSGGAGGNGGAASVFLGGGLLTTTGRHADGAAALSVGGGGGVGGDVEGGGAGISISLGGQGGIGGDGSTAVVANGFYAQDQNNNWYLVPGGVISTTGSYARGIGAASIGGGGGRGGDADGANLGLLSLTIGGNGGTGGQGGPATAYNFGVVQTRGNHAVGIDVASIGGGGGIGGAAHSYDVGEGFSASVAVGGSGGGCNAAACPIGGAAAVNNFGQVLTLGSDAHGIRAQSIGGGGGAGGASVAETLALNPGSEEVPSIALTTSLGGSGGSGGSATTVNVLNAGMIITQGVAAAGVMAQAVGGGGGTGGDSSATSQNLAPTSLTVTTSLGGSGGAGGNGGTVQVNNSGFIWTLHDQAPGIVAQSVGGGGGNGGFGRASTGSRGGGGGNGDGLTVNVSVGGSGHSGGDGGAVNVFNYVTAGNNPYSGNGASSAFGTGGIATLGDGSDGIYAHSIGGGGGSGNNATAAGGKGQIVVNVAVGGNGGSGGNGGPVNVDNGAGAILTYGAAANGIFAQSVGGGGGRGGTGGTGHQRDPQSGADTFLQNGLGLNKAVTPVPNSNGVFQWTSAITGAFSQPGTLGQVVNGYAGANAQGYTPDTPNASQTTTHVNIGAGFDGAGGAGGIGGTVTVNNAAGGTIQTAGPLSAGIFAQSIGGGGGVGGASNPAMDSVNLSQSSAGGTISIGGRNGASGWGGDVTVTNGGGIATAGDVSPAILAQSVGGGGGYGATTVMSPSASIIQTVTLGMDGSGSGWNLFQNSPGLSGQTVTVNSSGTIATTGNDSPGILAQSVGGGGGIAAVMSAIYDPTTGKASSATGNLAQTQQQQVQISFMGNAPYDQSLGVHSVGGTVNAALQNSGTITTAGQNSYGILAQSVGNGGGIIISDYRVTAPTLFPAPVGVLNNGGAVIVSAEYGTAITTQGSGGVGILAQSAGGGGIVNGVSGIDLRGGSSGGLVQAGNTASFGGSVRVNAQGQITTNGTYAHGILAQSVGGGGLIGQGDGTGFVIAGVTGVVCPPVLCVAFGSVAVTLSNPYNFNSNPTPTSVNVQGAGSYGVVLISQGNPKGANITALTVGTATSIVAAGSAAGAVFVGGADSNTITVQNGGAILGNQSGTNVAIDSWAANPATAQINSSGTISGNINVGSGSTLNNAGYFQSGKQVNLGRGGVLTNSGTLSIGAAGQATTTALTGSLVQVSTGQLVLDTNHRTGEADRLDVQGSVRLGGTLDVRASGLANRAVTVLTATDGVSLDPGLVATRTHLFRFEAQQLGNAVQVQPQAEFVAKAAGFGSNQQAVAAGLQQAWQSGTSLGGGFDTLAGIADARSYRTALSSLAGSSVGGIVATRQAASDRFSGNLINCEPYRGGPMPLREESCAWLRTEGMVVNLASSGDDPGYRQTSLTYQLGGQKEVAPGWFVGASAGYETSWLRGDDDGSKVSGQSALFGLLLKRQTGPWTLSGVVDGGYGWYQSKRQVAVGTTTGQASGSPGVGQAGLHARASYQLALGSDWYVRPALTTSAVYRGISGYAESGPTPFNLNVRRSSGVSGAVSPMVELGRGGVMPGLGTLRGFVGLGAAAYVNNDWKGSASFQVPSTGTDTPFTSTTRLPSAVGKLQAGLDLFTLRGVEAKLTYDAALAPGYAAQSLTGRLAYVF